MVMGFWGSTEAEEFTGSCGIGGRETGSREVKEGELELGRGVVLGSGEGVVFGSVGGVFFDAVAVFVGVG